MAESGKNNRYYSWLKQKAKTFLTNRKSIAKTRRIGRAEYQSVKQNYETFIDEVIAETEQYRNSVNPSLSRPEHPIRIGNYEPVSMVGDSMGRVFRYEGKILRGIYSEQFDAFKQIYDSGMLTVLARHRLIPEVTVTDYVTEEFGLVLGVETVQIQDSRDWTYAMYKDACILVSVLGKILHHFGFTLVDGHLNNVTFDHGNPMFVDIGSIITGTGTGYRTELLFAGIYHLVFGFIGNSMLYRMVTHDDNNGNIFVFPRSYNLMAREYQMAAGVMKRHYLFHGSFVQNRMVHRMFAFHEYDAWDIDLLFPITEETAEPSWTEEAAEILASLDGVHTALTAGGTCGYLEARLMEKRSDIAFTVSDFREHRLDLAYQRLKRVRGDCAIRLYNCLYLMPDHVTLLKSDLALFIDPLNDSPAFWPVNDSVLANAICRLSDQWIAILYPKTEADTYRNLFETSFTPFVNTYDVREIAQGEWCLALLKRDHGHSVHPDEG